jgi:hypothetical protein
MKRVAELLREIAEDYLHLAADADGVVDPERRKRYQWLLKLAERLTKQVI